MVVGVVFTVLELRNLVKTRQRDLVMRLYSTFGSREYLQELQKLEVLEVRNYEDFVKRYGTIHETPYYIAFGMVSTLFEGIGVLLYRKVIDIELVDDLFRGVVQSIWEEMKPIAEGAREQHNLPAAFERFEYLYNEMKKREQQLAKIQ